MEGQFNISPQWNRDVAAAYYGSTTNYWEGYGDIVRHNYTGGTIFKNPTISTYSYFGSNNANEARPMYAGGVLSLNGETHFVPYSASVGQKINVNGSFTTYNLMYTNVNGAYAGGVLNNSGIIHWAPYLATIGQYVRTNGSVFTYSLSNFGRLGSYIGGVLMPDGRVHFIPFNSTTGLIVEGERTVTTYTNTNFGFSFFYGGVLGARGDVYFVPHKVGSSNNRYLLKRSVTGSIIKIPITIEDAGIDFQYGAYAGGVLDMDGDIHFAPYRSSVGLKIDKDDNISTYQLVYTNNAINKYVGAVLASNGEIHFVPHQAIVGQKVSPNGVVSTYSIGSNTPSAFFGGIATLDNNIHLIPHASQSGLILNVSSVNKFEKGFCILPYINKF